MLIVVVIIGILAAALVPKITGYMERTRDLKRQTDLRNIAFAVEMYRNDYWELPFYSGGVVKSCSYLNQFIRSTNELEAFLGDYLSSIPSSVKGKSPLGICKGGQTHDECKKALQSWGYLYTIQKERPGLRPLDQGKTIGVLVAKVETPDFANFVLVSEESSCNGCHLSLGVWNCDLFSMFPGRVGKKLNLCDRIEKGDIAEWKEENGQMVCTYTSAEQLYYLLKVE